MRKSTLAQEVQGVNKHSKRQGSKDLTKVELVIAIAKNSLKIGGAL